MVRDSERLDGDLELENFKKLISSYEKARNEGSAPFNPMLEDLLRAMKSEEAVNEDNLRVPGLRDEKDVVKAQEIIPEPCYFVKLWDTEGQKYFVNMCGSPKIAAPGEWKYGVPPELEESLSHLEAHSEYGSPINLRFSLSCSDYILSKDKSGKICKVFDVVFNAEVIKQSMVSKQLKHFLINMAMTWISQKHGLELKSDFKIPKGTYMGDTIRKHFIRADKVKLVTEISEDSQPSFPLVISDSKPLETQNSNSMKEKEELLTAKCLESIETNVEDESTMHHHILQANTAGIEEILDIVSVPHQDVESKLPLESDVKRIPAIDTNYIGSPVELVTLCLSFPFSVDTDKSKVYISNTMLYLEIFSYSPVEVPLPFPTAPNEAKAVFCSLRNQLEIYVPFLSYTKLLAMK